MSTTVVGDTPTPGPWTLHDNDGEFEITAWQSETMLRTLATVRYPADARLMAAAPDLLEAGNDLVDAILTAAPSTMYPKIVQDALSSWVNAAHRAEGRADS